MALLVDYARDFQRDLEVTITLTKDEIRARLAVGQRLRWLSGDVVGDREKNMRWLFLGRDELDRDTSWLVIEMEQAGEVTVTRDRRNTRHVLDYAPRS